MSDLPLSSWEADLATGLVRIVVQPEDVPQFIPTTSGWFGRLAECRAWKASWESFGLCPWNIARTLCLYSPTGSPDSFLEGFPEPVHGLECDGLADAVRARLEAAGTARPEATDSEFGEPIDHAFEAQSAQSRVMGSCYGSVHDWISTAIDLDKAEDNASAILHYEASILSGYRFGRAVKRLPVLYSRLHYSERALEHLASLLPLVRATPAAKHITEVMDVVTERVGRGLK